MAAARAHYEQALAISRMLGLRLAEAQYLGNLGGVEHVEGKYAAARAYQLSALSLQREIGNRAGEALTLYNLAVAVRTQGDLSGARNLFEQALHISRESGLQLEECYDLVNLAGISNRMGDYMAAQAYAEQSLALARELGVLAVQGYALGCLGEVLAGLGKFAAARQVLEATIAIWQELGLEVHVIEARAEVARVCLAQSTLSTGAGEDLATALSEVQTLMDYIEAHRSGELDHGLTGIEDPLQILLTCSQVLQANNDPRAADVLARAYAILQTETARLGDAEARQMYVENIPYRREIVAAYAQHFGHTQ